MSKTKMERILLGSAAVIATAASTGTAIAQDTFDQTTSIINEVGTSSVRTDGSESISLTDPNYTDLSMQSGDDLGNHVATQDVDMGTFAVTNMKDPVNLQDAVTLAYLAAYTAGMQDNLGNHIAEQALDMNNYAIINLPDPTGNLHAVNKRYVDGLVSNINGADNLGNHVAEKSLSMSGFKITNVATPTASSDAVNLGYLTSAVAGAADNLGNHTATQELLMRNFRITGLADPVDGTDAVNLNALEAGLSAVSSNFEDRRIDTADGILGGGDLSQDRTLTFDTTWGDARYARVVRKISAGTGLTGGGSLLTDFTIGFDESWGDARYVSVAGNQTVTGSKIFTGAVSVPEPKQGAHATTKTYVDGLVSTSIVTYSAGDGIDLTGTTFSVDNTVVRTTGDQLIAGIKDFTGTVKAHDIAGGMIRAGDGGALTMLAGGTPAHLSAVTAATLTPEGVWLGGEDGVFAISSPDDWVSGIAGRNQVTLLDKFGDTKLLSLQMSGQIDMNGRKIVSVALPTQDLDAANKKYVDDHFAAAGIAAGDGIDVTDQTVSVDGTVVRTNGDQIIAGDKIFTGTVSWNKSPTNNDDLTNKGYVDGLVAAAQGTTYTAGSGIDIDAVNDIIAVDGTVLRTTGDQSASGVKTFTGTARVTAAPVAGTDIANKDYVDSMSASYAAGDGLALNGTTFAVDGTIVRTTGNQSILGTKRFQAIQSAQVPSTGDDLTNKTYVDGVVKTYTAGNGLTLTGTEFSVASNVVLTTGTQSIGGVKTFTGTVKAPQTPVANDDVVNKGYLDGVLAGLSGGGGGGGSTTYTAGSGLSLSGTQFAVNGTVVRTSGDQSISGSKTFSGAVNVPTPTSAAHATTKQYVDNLISNSGTYYTGGSGINVSGTEISADSTVVRTSGYQVIAGAKNFTEQTLVEHIRTRNGGGLHLTAGETNSHVNKAYEDGEYVYLGAESGVKVVSSPDNWASATKNVTIINDAAGNSDFANTVYARSLVAKSNGSATAPAVRFTSDPNTGMYLHGGDQLGLAAGGSRKVWVGTGSVFFDVIPRTSKAPTANDHLTNKLYVDGKVKTYTAGSGLSLSGNQFSVNNSVVRTSGDQSIANTKTFTGTLRVNRQPTANTDVANKQYVDGKVKTYSAGSGLSLSGTQFNVDGTVVRTSGSQDIHGYKKFVNTLLAQSIHASSGNGIHITAGESNGKVNPAWENGEYVYLGAEGGVKVVSSSNDWANTDKNITTINDSSGNSWFHNYVWANNFLTKSNGSASAPAFRFKNDTNTGVYLHGGDQLGLAAGGSRKVWIGTGSVFFDVIPRTSKAPTANDHLANKQYVDGKVKTYSAGSGLSLSGTTFSLDYRRAGESSVGALRYNGGSRSDGYWFSHSTNHPSNGNRSLKFQGNLWAYYMYSRGYYYHSDERLKENIDQISGDEGMATVRAIAPVSYDWKDGSGHANGVIAQQVETVMPEIVKTDANDMKTVDYIQMIAPMLAAIQQLDERVTALEGATDLK